MTSLEVEMSLRPFILVIGLDGGGTSAVAQMLLKLGVDMNPSLRPSDRGYFKCEDDDLLRSLGSIATANAYMKRRALQAAPKPVGAKRPRACLLGEHADASELQCVIVNVVRPLEQCLLCNERYNGPELKHAVYTVRLWRARRLLLQAKPATVTIEWEDVIRDPASVALRLASSLSLGAGDSQIAAAAASVTDYIRRR